jgi:hypothetical protein
LDPQLGDEGLVCAHQYRFRRDQVERLNIGYRHDVSVFLKWTDAVFLGEVLRISMPLGFLESWIPTTTLSAFP